MQLDEFFEGILKVHRPWHVVEARLLDDGKKCEIHLACREGEAMPCRKCGAACPRYDTRRRRWRHLDTCEAQTWIECDVPRVRCKEHGVVQVEVPWSEPGSRWTIAFECVVIDWLTEASVSAVARRMRLSWTAIYNIQARAVRRGLARRAPLAPERIGVDETSFQKRPEYVTVVSDLERGTVLWVADGRGKEGLDGFYRGLSDESREGITAVAMDMWKPYIFSTAIHVEEAENKICFDRFHVSKHLNEAVDRVRRTEHRQLMDQGDDRLKGTKYLWLRRPHDLRGSRRMHFRELKDTALKVARAWAIKEAATLLWRYKVRGWARRAWNRWLSWASRSRLRPIVSVARMIRYHLIGIINAIVLGVTNARAEGVNSKIQQIKRMACGYRNRERFREAILFHLGRLDLYPRASATHTNG